MNAITGRLLTVVKRKRNKKGHLVFTIRTPFLDKHQETIFFPADCFVNREVLFQSVNTYFVPEDEQKDFIQTLWMLFGVGYEEGHIVVNATDSTVRYVLPRYLASLIFVASQFSSKSFLL